MLNAPLSRAFGQMLREYRVRAGLTQEGLAERAGLGRRSIQGLERGENAPRRETTQHLVRALALSPKDRSHFEAAARSAQRRPLIVPDAPPPVISSIRRRPEQPPSQNLPAFLTSFIGREPELMAVNRLLGASRLLTLTGPPGTGKTRLAVESARKVGPDFRDGIYFVPLASLDNPDLVLSAVAQRVGLRDIRGRALAETLATLLGNRQILLVLDNFEHVLTAARNVADLIQACPGLRVLVTSRSPLRVQGEQILPVLPLPVPDPTRTQSDEDLSTFPSVQLFVERSRAVNPDFFANPLDLRAVGEICRRLDGLPLAIELAAARSAILSPPALLSRLEHRLPLLTGGARNLPARQQTLRAAIDWSHSLLDTNELRLFRRLAVFAGGWSIAAADVVCVSNELSVKSRLLDSETASGQSEVLDTLGSLVDKGLVQTAERATPTGYAEPRFGMLETLREYAAERLLESGESEEVRRRHAAYYLAVAEEVGHLVYGPEAPIWLDRLEQDHDNFRAALRWAEDQNEGETSLRLGAALYRFWWLRPHAAEGWQWLTRALAGATGRQPDDDRQAQLARAQALHAAAAIAQGGLWDHALALPLFAESLAMLRVVGDRRSVANSLHNLAIVTGSQGDYPRAWSLFDESIGLWREVGERWGIAAALRGMTDLAVRQGDYERARSIAEECLDLARADGFAFQVAQALSNLGLAAFGQGDSATARERIEESLAIYCELGADQYAAVSRVYLAKVELQAGEVARARSLLMPALAALWEIGERGWGIVRALDAFAALAAAEARPARAWRLAGAAKTLSSVSGVPTHPAAQGQLDRSLEMARQVVGDDMASAAWSDGQAMTVEQAVTYALSDDKD